MKLGMFEDRHDRYPGGKNGFGNNLIAMTASILARYTTR